MALSLPASREIIADRGGLPTRTWWRYFQEVFNLLTGKVPFVLPLLPAYADDEAAAATIPLGGLYWNTIVGAVTQRRI